MIINDTPTIKKYLPVNASVNFDNIKPSIKAAERKFLKPLIGKSQLDILSASSTDAKVLEAIDLAQESVANLAYYLGLPISAVQINDAGIHVVDGNNSSPATDKQFKELQRSFKRSGHEALDELLELMEDNPDKFSAWLQSDSYSVHNSLLVNKTSVFNKYYYIFNSRQTFIALTPNIRSVEDQFILPSIGSELLKALKNKQTVAERKEVKVLLQQSIVAYTVMKTVDNGMFVMDGQGMHMRFDELPYEKTVTNINLKVNEFLVRTKKNKQIEGEEYLKMAVDKIKLNLQKFEEFEVNESSASPILYNSKSVVSM
jgi:hypothetical protein